MSIVVGSADRTVRPAATTGVVGALGFLGTALAQAADPVHAVRWNIPSAVAALLLVGAVVGLWRSGAAGSSRVARIGLVVVASGWAAMAVALVVAQARGEEITALYIVATILHVVGMTPVGVAVLRVGVWTGWRRWMPLLCAAYLLAGSPLFGMPGTPGLLGVAGWGACWLGLGSALLRRPAVIIDSTA